MVVEHRGEYGSEWETICSVADKLGPRPETIRLWIRQAEADDGERSAPTSGQLDEMRRLKRENAELRRANDILKAAASFFGAELDRRSTR
jgi:transposase